MGAAGKKIGLETDLVKQGLFSVCGSGEIENTFFPASNTGMRWEASRTRNRREMNQSARNPITRAQVMPRVANNVGRTGEGKMKSNDGWVYRTTTWGSGFLMRKAGVYHASTHAHTRRLTPNQVTLKCANCYYCCTPLLLARAVVKKNGRLAGKTGVTEVLRVIWDGVSLPAEGMGGGWHRISYPPSLSRWDMPY
ncbi:hypothetical protein J3E69DRAFT_276164 [Trichoderma sp. SZMC 28015]